MVDEIIIGALIILGFLGIRFSIKHFLGRGGRCGGGSVRKEKESCKKVN